MAYIAIYGARSGTSGGKSELLEKFKSWKKGSAVAKVRGRTTLPSYIEKELADRIATQGRHGVIWLPKNVEVIPLDRDIFQGSYGVVRRVTICGASFIPEWIEFAGKTMKAKNSLKNRKERSIEALACLVDHLGVIKIQYLNMRTYESYSMWWNGGSLKNMREYDHSIAEVHERKILCNPGLDYEAQKNLVEYQKHRVYLAWALMCIVDVVHKHDVLHNDLNPNNVMLHFPRDRDGVVFIGMCDWKMATWTNKEAPSNYRRNSLEELVKHKEKYNCVGPELFHVRGERGTSLSLMRMAWKHRHTYVSESFSVGALTKKIYHHDSTSNLFQQNWDPNVMMMQFEVGLDALTKINLAERLTITHVVNSLKSPPYNMATPNMCFHDTIT